MKEAHSRAIVFLLAAILCVMLFGPGAVLTALGWGVAIGLVIGAFCLVAWGCFALFAGLVSEIANNREQGKPWLWLPVFWIGLIGDFIVIGIAAIYWLEGGYRFKEAISLVPYWWVPVAFMAGGGIIIAIETSAKWVPEVPGKILGFFKAWLMLLIGPVAAPVGRWKTIRHQRSTGEHIGLVSAGLSISGTFLVSVLLWFVSTLIPLSLGVAIISEISR